jgi:hypothetical protein
MLIIRNLRLNTCPTAIEIIYLCNKMIKKAHIYDHFYPKAIYPFFALYFYNLIPSCKVCNKMKSESIIDIHAKN